MTRRITCYVVLVTLIWGAHTNDEERVRDMFKSNMTRNDFSNLLQSLIKLNEQRVNVLQKLYRLEDYGVLSEVLRSGDKKTGNGSPNNLFLIVMSKNQNDPSRRKIGFRLVDSVSPLNTGSNNNHHKLNFVLDPAAYFTQNIRKENRLESMFEKFPRFGPTKNHRADDGSKQIGTTKEKLKFNKPRDSNILRAATSLKENEESKYHKENSTYEIVNNKGRRPNAKELLGYDGNRKHPQTVGYYSQSNEYVEIDFKTANKKLTTKPNITKHIITSNHQNSKYPSKDKDEDDYGSVENYQSIQYTKIISDISIKKKHGNNHKTKKYTPNVKFQTNQQKDKPTTKLILVKDILSNHQNPRNPLEVKDEQDKYFYGSPLRNIENDPKRQHTKMDSDISVGKFHDKHYNSKINTKHNHQTKHQTPKLKVQSNQQNGKQTIKSIIKKEILSRNPKNSKYPLEGKDAQVRTRMHGSPISNIENYHNIKYTKIISDISLKKHDSNHKTSKYSPKVKVQSKQQNDKLTTKPITIKDIITSNRQNSNYPLEVKDEDDYGSPFSNIENDHYSQYANMNSDIPKLYVNNHQKVKTNKIAPRVKVQNNQQNNKLTTKPITIKDIIRINHKNTKYPLEGKDELDEDDYGSLFSNIKNDHYSQYTNKNSDISIKKLHVNNHHNPKTVENTPKVNIQRNQNPELNQKKSNLNNQGNKYSKIKDVITTTPKNYYRINGTLKNANENNHVSKSPNLNQNNTNANNDDLTYTSIKDEYATKDTKLPSLAKDVYGSKPIISEITKDPQNGSYPDFKDHKDIRNKSNKDKPEIVKGTLYGNYTNFEDHKDVRDNSDTDKPKTAKDTPFENDPGFQNLKVVRDNSSKDKPETTYRPGTPFGNNFHGFEHHKNVMKNLSTVKELHQDNPNVKSKKDTDYYGVKMFDNGKSGEEFSVFITNVGNRTAEEVKQQNDPKLTLNAFDKHRSKHIARKPFGKCLHKKALKLCCKSCIRAYKNVCRKLKCTSRSKKALKSECKRSCKKTFVSSSSKYSYENSGKESSGDEYSDESDSEYT